MIQGGVTLGVPVAALIIQGAAALATAVATATEAEGLLGNTQDVLHQYRQQGLSLRDPVQGLMGLMLIVTQDLVQDH